MKNETDKETEKTIYYIARGFVILAIFQYRNTSLDVHSILLSKTILKALTLMRCSSLNDSSNKKAVNIYIVLSSITKYTLVCIILISFEIVMQIDIAYWVHTA